MYLSFSPTFPTIIVSGVFAVLFIAHVKIDAYSIGSGYKNNVIAMHQVLFLNRVPIVLK